MSLHVAVLSEALPKLASVILGCTTKEEGSKEPLSAIQLSRDSTGVGPALPGQSIQGE